MLRLSKCDQWEESEHLERDIEALVIEMAGEESWQKTSMGVLSKLGGVRKLGGLTADDKHGGVIKTWIEGHMAG